MDNTNKRVSKFSIVSIRKAVSQMEVSSDTSDRPACLKTNLSMFSVKHVLKHVFFFFPSVHPYRRYS